MRIPAQLNKRGGIDISGTEADAGIERTGPDRREGRERFAAHAVVTVRHSGRGLLMLDLNILDFAVFFFPPDGVKKAHHAMPRDADYIRHTLFDKIFNDNFSAGQFHNGLLFQCIKFMNFLSSFAGSSTEPFPFSTSLSSHAIFLPSRLIT